MLHADQSPEDLDPRRRQRGLIRRDWMSATRSISIPRVHELLATVLVRLGFVR